MNSRECLQVLYLFFDNKTPEQVIRGEEFLVSAFLDVLTSNYEDSSLREQCEDDSAVKRSPVFYNPGK